MLKAVNCVINKSFRKYLKINEINWVFNNYSWWCEEKSGNKQITWIRWDLEFVLPSLCRVFHRILDKMEVYKQMLCSIFSISAEIWNLIFSCFVLAVFQKHSRNKSISRIRPDEPNLSFRKYDDNWKQSFIILYGQSGFIGTVNFPNKCPRSSLLFVVTFCLLWRMRRGNWIYLSAGLSLINFPDVFGWSRPSFQRYFQWFLSPADKAVLSGYSLYQPIFEKSIGGFIQQVHIDNYFIVI